MKTKTTKTVRDDGTEVEVTRIEFTRFELIPVRVHLTIFAVWFVLFAFATYKVWTS